MKKNKDTIIVFSANVDQWGAERSITSMCAGLQAKGYKVLVIIPKLGKIQDLLNNVEVESMVFPFPMAIINESYHELPLWRRFVRRRHRLFHTLMRPFDMLKLKHILYEKKINPIAVYSATITIDYGVRFAKFLGVKHIQHIRENLSAFGYQLYGGNKKGFELIRKNSSVIICTCKAISDYYIDNFYSNTIHIVYNGVPEVQIEKKEKSNDKILLIQTTRLMKDKNVMDSIKAIEYLVSMGCNKLRLDIFGNGSEEDKIREYIHEHHLSEYIQLKGFSNSIDYSIYHIGLITSIFEAFARCTLEYMSNGLAVVASNTGGNLEQVVNGKTGYFYELGKPLDMAIIIKKLYENPKSIITLGTSGLERFHNCFTQKHYVEQITDIIISNIK